MFCPSCGKPIPDESKFCLHCGTPIPEKSTSNLISQTRPSTTQVIYCPRCRRVDAVQKVESILDEGTANVQASGTSGLSTTKLAQYFTLPDMPKDHTTINKDRVVWRIKRYKRSMLYYCHRDHVVFVPGEDMIIEPSGVQSYLADNIIKKYCVIQSIIKSGWVTAEHYFVARVPIMDKLVADTASVKSNEFSLRFVTENMKAHAELVQQLQNQGWQLIEEEFKPAPWFEWLFSRI